MPPVPSPQHPLILPVSPSKSSFHYLATIGTEVADDLLQSCAKLFSTNYGVWDEMQQTISPRSLPGQPVKLSASRLRAQCLSSPESTVLVTCFQGDILVGHAFVTVWSFDDGVVGWVTQLVVDVAVRKRYIATHLLQTLKSHPLFYNVTAIGLVSSHPAAVAALTKYSNVKIELVDTNFIVRTAKKIFQVAPIAYLQPSNIDLRGSLFQNEYDNGVVCSVFTQFYVDHREPLEALEVFKKAGRWCLGELLDGHEFLIVVPVIPKSI